MYPVSILQLKLITCWYSYGYGVRTKKRSNARKSVNVNLVNGKMCSSYLKIEREMEVVFKKMDPISTQFKVNQIKEAVNKANVPAQFCRKGKSSKLET